MHGNYGRNTGQLLRILLKKIMRKDTNNHGNIKCITKLVMCEDTAYLTDPLAGGQEDL